MRAVKSKKIDPRGMDMDSIFLAINNKYKKQAIGWGETKSTNQNIRPKHTRFLWENINKFYSASIQRTLFGDLSVIQEWGSTGSKYGNNKISIVSSVKEALDLVSDIHNRRTKRGYNLTKQF